MHFSHLLKVRKNSHSLSCTPGVSHSLSLTCRSKISVSWLSCPVSKVTQLTAPRGEYRTEFAVFSVFTCRYFGIFGIQNTDVSIGVGIWKYRTSVRYFGIPTAVVKLRVNDRGSNGAGCIEIKTWTGERVNGYKRGCHLLSEDELVSGECDWNLHPSFSSPTNSSPANSAIPVVRLTCHLKTQINAAWVMTAQQCTGTLTVTPLTSITIILHWLHDAKQQPWQPPAAAVAAVLPPPLLPTR